MSQVPAVSPPIPGRVIWWLGLAIALLGIALRVYPSAGFKGVGFDEALYRNFVLKLDVAGLGGYPEICALHIEDQSQPGMITKLPPTRFLYIFSGWLWKHAEFGDASPVERQNPGFASLDPALVSLHRVACLYSCLLLLLIMLASGRMLGGRSMLITTALTAFSPILIQMGQHALIDGVLAFWAMLCLWLLWENLRRPGQAGWLLAWGVSLALLVLTKENSFFVYLALMGLILVNRWTRWGTVTWQLWLVAILGPLAGVLTLVLLCGGVEHFLRIYQLLVSKAQNLEYAIRTGDGPWYRYLVDLLLASPLVLCLAIGGLFTQTRQSRPLQFLVLFMVMSYLIMCNIRYAMNLRYATIWEFTLRALAATQLIWLTSCFAQRQKLVLIVTTVALCAFDLNQYVVYFVDGKLYELASEGLLRSVKILK